MGGAGYSTRPGGQAAAPPPPYSADDFMKKMKESAKKRKNKVTRKRKKMKPKTAPLDDADVDAYIKHVAQTPIPSKVHTPIDFTMSHMPLESPPPYASPPPPQPSISGSASGSSRSRGDGESIEAVSSAGAAITFLSAKPIQDFPPVHHPKEAFVNSASATTLSAPSSNRQGSPRNAEMSSSEVARHPRTNGRAPSPFLHMSEGLRSAPVDIDVYSMWGRDLHEMDNPAFEGDEIRMESTSPIQRGATPGQSEGEPPGTTDV